MSQYSYLISNCLVLKCKQHSASNPSQPKGVGLVRAEPHTSATPVSETPDIRFQPFIFNGVVSLTGKPDDDRSVHFLRDTGCSQSVILADALPFSEFSYCGYCIVLSGI